MRNFGQATHTVALMELSPLAYREISDKLRAAGYDHAILKEGADEVLDMSGIGLTCSLSAKTAESGKDSSEQRQNELLVEALQWLPETLISFCDRNDFLEEVRGMGWKPRSECTAHKFVDSDSCVYCHFCPDDEPEPPPPSKAKGGM